MKNALAYDEVPPAKFNKWSDTHPLFIDELKARSAARVAADPEFHYVMEDMERLRHKLDDNRISLNEEVRRRELDEQKIRKETRSKDRLARHEEEPSIYRLTLETVDNPKLQLIMYPGKIAEAKNKGAMSLSLRRCASRVRTGPPLARRDLAMHTGPGISACLRDCSRHSAFEVMSVNARIQCICGCEPPVGFFRNRDVVFRLAGDRAGVAADAVV